MFNHSTKIFSLSKSLDKIKTISEEYKRRSPQREKVLAEIPDEVQNEDNIQTKNPTMNTEKFFDVKNPDFPYVDEQTFIDSFEDDEDDDCLNNDEDKKKERILKTQTLTQYYDVLYLRPNTRRECMEQLVKKKPLPKLKLIGDNGEDMGLTALL